MKTPRSKLANVITGSRFLLAIVFVLLFLFDTMATRLLLLVTLLAILLSDVIDGSIARHFGSISPSQVGSVLDSMADDFVFIAVFICLFSKGIVPIWFVLLVLWTRSFIAFVRLLTVVQGKPYAGPRLSTKAKGATYGFGLVYLIGIYSLSGTYNLPDQPVITQAVISLMAILTGVAASDFIIAHRHTLLTLFMDC
jgi:phosphatidylglycerophosphate synthase